MRRLDAVVPPEVVVESALEELSEGTCKELLQANHFGRIAVNGSEGPEIFPVNYWYEDDRIAIRTSPGTKLAAAAQNVVGFEIDHVDDEARSGWSVLVVGNAYEVTNSIDTISVAVQGAPIDSWAPGPKTSLVRIEPRSISGRVLRSGRS